MRRIQMPLRVLHRASFLCALILYTACRSEPAHAQALSLTFTNRIMAESQATLESWGRVHIPTPKIFSVFVSIETDDPSEILAPTGVTIVAGTTSAAFSLSPIPDAHLDGTIPVSLTATASGYTGATGILQVADTGGTVPRVGFKLQSTTDLYTFSESNLSLGGPVKDNYSSAAILQDTGEILVLLNRGQGINFEPRIKVYSTNGIYQRTIDMAGFNDPEGICHVTNDLYAICEEGINDDITIIPIDGATAALTKASGQIVNVTLPFGKSPNKGMEGVAYDVMNDCFYVVQEAFPMGVYRVCSTTNGTSTEVLFDAQQVFSNLVTDLSDLTYDPHSGHLFILSDEGDRIFECTMSGELLSSTPLHVNQAEGLTFYNNRRILFVVGEPNHGYWFSLDPRTGCGLEGTNETFTVALSRPLTNAVDISFAARDFGSTGWADYGPVTGVLSIAPGQICSSFTIAVSNDTVSPEDDEAFLLLLSNRNASISIGANDLCLYTIKGTPHALDIASQYGTPLPQTGTTYYAHEWLLECTVPDSPLDLPGGTQLVCVGWTGTGSAPASGSGADTGGFTVTNDSSLTWSWATNLTLLAAAKGGGVVYGGNVWVPLGTNVMLHAETNQYYRFAGWTGDTSGADTNQAAINLGMTHARTLTACFTPLLATNETPLWWLAQIYGHTDNFDVVATSDSDMDGFQAWEEFIADSDPTNQHSLLALTTITRFGQEFSVGWPGSTQRVYCVYGGDTSTNLQDATMMTNGMPGANAPETVFSGPVTSSLPAFLWIEVSLP